MPSPFYLDYIGTILPITEIAGLAQNHQIRLHTDAAQSVEKILTNVNELGVDLLSAAGHKLCVPKGTGCKLFVLLNYS